MSLNIKNEETVKLVRQLAAELHVSMTAAITDAVRARLDEIRSTDHEIDVEAQRILEIWRELGARAGPDYASRDFDALLYDEKGLPR